jgi:hypothetical protein
MPEMMFSLCLVVQAACIARGLGCRDLVVALELEGRAGQCVAKFTTHVCLPLRHVGVSYPDGDGK